MLIRRRMTGTRLHEDRWLAAGLAFAVYGFVVVFLFAQLSPDFG